jgi:hypothetical protein
MGWMQEGRNPDTDGDWGAGGDKADFKTSLIIEDPDGKPILYDNIEDGQQSWDMIPPSSKVKWTVNTDGHDDRVSLRLTYWDMDLFISSMNTVLDSLSESQRTQYGEGDPVIEESVIQQTMTQAGGMERLMVEMWSDIRTTGSDGELSGTITVERNWPKTIYFFNAHYGYAADEETSNWSKTGWVALETLGYAALTIAAIATLGGAGVLAGVAWGVSNAVMIVEMSKFGNKYLAVGYGPATENKYGDQFPILGFNHTYTFFVDTPEENVAQTWLDLMNDDNIALIEKANIALTALGVVKVGVIGMLLLLLIHKRRSKGD